MNAINTINDETVNVSVIKDDPVRFAALHAALRLHATVLHADDDGMLLTRNGQHFLAGTVDLTPFLPDIKLILTDDPKQVEKLLAMPQFSEELSCMQGVYLHESAPKVNTEGVTFRRFERADFPFVHAHYHTGRNARSAYVMARIMGGDMIGAFVSGEPAGFIGIHREGAMGMLEVLPAYRRRGVGAALEAELIRRMLENGLLPYCHVFSDNLPSMELQKRLCLTFLPTPVHWVC